MKKLIASMTLGLFVLGGCSVGDLIIDDVAVHNGLVQTMDMVLAAEGNFYNEYWLLEDGMDTTMFLQSYESFIEAVDSLDTFFTETKFSSSQAIFVTEYNEYYKPFIDEYVNDVKEFTDIIAKDGFTYEVMEPYFEAMDQKTIDFIDIHNQLINTINLQSDVDADDGKTY